MNKNKDKFCRDCKWHEAGSVSAGIIPGFFDRCLSPKNVERTSEQKNLITGIPDKTYFKLLFCRVLRRDNVDGCGTEGKWFELEKGTK